LLTVIVSAVLIGLSLGLLGAGGSILTVPVLAYAVGFSEKQAIIAGLFIVAAISASTVLINLRKGHIHVQAAIGLAITGIVGSALAANLSRWVSGEVQFLLLAIIMLLAGWRMLKPVANQSEKREAGGIRLVLTGVMLGAVTGFVGVGGGFLVVPALVTLLSVPMRLAVNTSLTVIFFNASAGFASHYYSSQSTVAQLDWTVLLTFAGVGVIGSLLGQAFAKKLPQDTLKKGFAWVILSIAIGVLVHALSQFIGGQP